VTAAWSDAPIRQRHGWVLPDEQQIRVLAPGNVRSVSDDDRPDAFYDDGETYTDVHERILRLMGAFSMVQERIEHAVRQRLQQTLPELGPVVAKRLMHRLSDDQRLALFVSLPADVGYVRLDVDTARNIYERARQTRNALAHSSGVFVLRDDPSRSRHIVTGRPEKFPQVPRRLQPSAVDQLVVECEWLHAHLLRLMYEAELVEFRSLIDEPSEPEIPPTRPPAP
jgi:hypothetical protein